MAYRYIGPNRDCENCGEEYTPKGHNQKYCHSCQMTRDTWTGKAKFRKRNQEFVHSYLEEHPCVDCGESDPIVLEFDHVRDEKDMNVSELVVRTASIERIKKEIEKCEVRCANCHRRKTRKSWV